MGPIMLNWVNIGRNWSMWVKMGQVGPSGSNRKYRGMQKKN